MRRALLIATALALAAAACGSDDDDGGAATSTAPTVPVSTTPATTTPTASAPIASSTTAESSTSASSGPGDPGTFRDPVLGAPRAVPEPGELCEAIPSGEALRATVFGNAAGPPEEIPNAPRGEPGCRLEGENVGEITVAIANQSEFGERPSSQGQWQLIAGNTAYVFCNDDESIDDQACAVFAAVDEDMMLTVFMFLPSNDLERLGADAARIAGETLAAFDPV